MQSRRNLFIVASAAQGRAHNRRVELTLAG